MTAKPIFSCRLTKATGENEATEITFGASDAGELRTRLATAGKVVQERVDAHNAAVVAVGEDVKRRVQEAAGKIQKQERKRLADAGLLPRELVDAEPASGVNGADTPTG